MNTTNETIVSGDMMKKLREAGVDSGYEPVPRDLQRHAKRMLGGKSVVTYSNDSKFKKKIARLQNRLNEARRREAFNSPIVLAQLESERALGLRQ